MIQKFAASSTRSSSRLRSSPSSTGRPQHLGKPEASQHFLWLRLPQRRAGFDVSQALVPFSSDSTFGRALLVGFLNTILVAVIGIITATLLGFLIGVGRLSRNWLIAKICTVYVEIFRNLPPLLVIFFWYLGVLSVLPGPRDSLRTAAVDLPEQPRLLHADARIG